MTDRNWQELFQEPDQLVPMLESLEADVDAAGGSVPGVTQTFSFAFTHATANLDTGATVYTPTLGQIIEDAWVELDTAFNGTTPKCDVGDFNDGSGWFGDLGFGALDATMADAENTHGLLSGRIPSDAYWAITAAGGGSDVPVNDAVASSPRSFPAKVTSTDPILVVVSQDGSNSGGSTGATAGAGVVYLRVCTPTASPG